MALHHLAGVYDDLGNQLTYGHIAERHKALLGPRLSSLAARHNALQTQTAQHANDPSHPVHAHAAIAEQDLAQAAQMHLAGLWHVEKYDVPIEYYAHKVLHNVGHGITVSQADIDAIHFHSLPDAVRVAADLAMKRNHKPYETSQAKNLFTTQGVSTLWNQAAGGGTTNSGGSAPGVLAWYNNAQARVGVGDSSTAAAASQIDLQAATNREWVGMDVSFPTLPGTNSNAIIARSTFTSLLAGYSWAELGFDNNNGSNVATPGSAARSSGAGTMLSRVVSNQGTKPASGQTWQATYTLTIS